MNIATFAIFIYFTVFAKSLLQHKKNLVNALNPKQYLNGKAIDES